MKNFSRASATDPRRARKIVFFLISWRLDLLNRFEFGRFVYVIFYTLVGLAICLMGGFVVFHIPKPIVSLSLY